MFIKYIMFMLACLTVLLTSGCDTSKRVNNEIAKEELQSQKLFHQVKQQVNERSVSSRKKGFWVSGKQIKLKDDEPAWLEEPVVLRIAKTLPSSEVFSVVSSSIHLPISIKPGAMSMLKGAGESSSSPSGGASGSADTDSSEKKITIDYTGTKRGLLDHIAGQLGIYWKLSRGSIEFYLLETRLFHIATLGGSMASSATVGGTSSGGGSSGGGGASGSSGGSGGSGGSSGGSVNAGSQDLSVTMNSEVWSELVKIVQSLVSPLGKVEASESLGLITITDVPPALASVGEIIDTLNESMNTQILIDVKVYSLELSNRDDYQLDWNTIFTTAQGSILNFATIPAAATGLSSITATMTSAAPRWKRWNGTNGVIKALSKIGKVAMVTSGTMITMDNQPVPINMQRSVTYLASAQAGAISTGVATGPTLTPGTVNTGFQMTVMPRVIDSKKVLLQCTINISSLQSLGTISSGTGVNALTIQTPEVISRSLLQRAMLQSGETLILTGFEQTELSSDRQGIGSSNNIFTGGARLASEKKSTLIVMITPYIVESKK